MDLSFATRTGTQQGIETHLFRAEVSRDLSHWTRSIVQGCHDSAELAVEISTGARSGWGRHSLLGRGRPPLHRGLNIGSITGPFWGTYLNSRGDKFQSLLNEGTHNALLKWDLESGPSRHN